MAVAPDPVEKGLEDLEEGLEDEITCPRGCDQMGRDKQVEVKWAEDADVAFE